MNEKNVAYLKDQLKYTGFGENLGERLREKIEQGLDTFTLQHQMQYGQSSMEAELYFSKSMTTDMYFFNAYIVTLSRKNAPQLTQTFYINKGNSITLKEAYNLINGRSVHKNFINKDGNSYECWVQMDFSKTTPNGNYKMNYYHESYGYNLVDCVKEYPILELELEEYKESIIASLQKGNLQMVTFDLEGQEEIRFIEANPKFKCINIYDENVQKLFSQQHTTPIKTVAEETPIPEGKLETKLEEKKESKDQNQKEETLLDQHKERQASTLKIKKRRRTIKKA